MPDVVAVTQDVIRREITDTVCNELRAAGFKSSNVEVVGKDTRCRIIRREEQRCYLERVRPHLLSADIRGKVDAVIRFLEKSLPPGRPRIPFRCPD